MAPESEESMSKTKFVMLLLNKLRRQLMEFACSEGWEEDRKVLTVLGWSYIVFWEIVCQDTHVQQQLRNLGIPCDKDYRNKLAHGGTIESEKLVQYAKGLMGGGFAELVIENVNEDLDELISDHYINGHYGVSITADTFA